MNEEKKPHPVPQTTNLAVAIMCVLGALLGLDSVIDAIDSGRTLRLVLGITLMLFGSLGSVLYLWLYFRNSRSN